MEDIVPSLLPVPLPSTTVYRRLPHSHEKTADTYGTSTTKNKNISNSQNNFRKQQHISFHGHQMVTGSSYITRTDFVLRLCHYILLLQSKNSSVESDDLASLLRTECNDYKQKNNQLIPILNQNLVILLALL